MTPSDSWPTPSGWLVIHVDVGTLYSNSTETKCWCLSVSGPSWTSLLGHETAHHHCTRPLALMLLLPAWLLPRCTYTPPPPGATSALGLTCPAKSPQTPMMHRILNTAEPTMVPTPTSPLVMKTPETQNQHQPGCGGRVCSKVGVGELVRLFTGSTGNSQGLERAS